MTKYNVSIGYVYGAISSNIEDEGPSQNFIVVESDNVGTSDNGDLIFTNNDKSTSAVFPNGRWNYFTKVVDGG